MAAYPTTKPKSARRWLVRLALLGGVAYAAFHFTGMGGHGDASQAAQGMAMPASVAAVVSKPVVTWSEFSGRIEAANSAEIRPRVGGQIVAIHFKDGEEVKRGEPLMTIDPRPYEAELVRAKGALTTAAATQKNAAQEFARAKALIKSKAISKAEYERAESAFVQANGALETANGAARLAAVNVGYAHITAPISGKISRAEITVGNNVEVGASTPLLASIVDLSPIYASFELDEQTYLNTIQGKATAQLKKIPVEVKVGGTAAAPITASIHAFDNQIAAGSGTIRVRALMENKDKTLVPGLFANVRIGSPEATPSILVNPVAIGTDQNKKFVLAIGADSKAEYREVTLGTMSEGLQIITSGLHEGDQIVVGGLQRLRPGVPVQAIATDMTTLKPLNAPETPAAAGTPPTEATN